MGKSWYGRRPTSPADARAPPDPEAERGQGPLSRVVNAYPWAALDVTSRDGRAVEDAERRARQIRAVLRPGDVQRTAQPGRPIKTYGLVEPEERLEAAHQHRPGAAFPSGDRVEAPVHP